MLPYAILNLPYLGKITSMGFSSRGSKYSFEIISLDTITSTLSGLNPSAEIYRLSSKSKNSCS